MTTEELKMLADDLFTRLSEVVRQSVTVETTRQMADFELRQQEWRRDMMRDLARVEARAEKILDVIGEAIERRKPRTASDVASALSTAQEQAGFVVRDTEIHGKRQD